jgi:hypothetical protein
MTLIFLPTLVVTALGLSAAKAGDLLRGPLFERKPCTGNASTVVWAYEATSKQSRTAGHEIRPGAWSPVHRNGSC